MVDAKVLKSSFLLSLKKVEQAVLDAIGEGLKNGTVDGKKLQKLRTICKEYHLLVNPNLDHFKPLMEYLGFHNYTAMHVSAFLRYYNGLYPAMALKLLFSIHTGKESYLKLASLASSGGIDKSVYGRESKDPSIDLYTIGKQMVVVPKTTEAKIKLLNLGIDWLNGKGDKFDFIDCDTMVCVYTGYREI